MWLFCDNFLWSIVAVLLLLAFVLHPSCSSILYQTPFLPFQLSFPSFSTFCRKSWGNFYAAQFCWRQQLFLFSQKNCIEDINNRSEWQFHKILHPKMHFMDIVYLLWIILILSVIAVCPINFHGTKETFFAELLKTVFLCVFVWYFHSPLVQL